MKISIMSLFRDSESYIYDCLNRLEQLEANTDASFEYMFYENDSIDDTRKILKDWTKSRQGFFVYEDLGYPKFSTMISRERNYVMTEYRNKLLIASRPFKSDYTIILDSDVVFDKHIINQYLDYMDDDVAMATPNVLQNIRCKMFDPDKKSYYDSYALLDRYENQCMTWAYNPFYFKEDRDLWDNQEPVEVTSAFGGVPMVRSKILNNVQWSTEGGCEHWAFCSMVKKFGKILAIPTIITEVDVPESIIKRIPQNDIDEVVKSQHDNLEKVL